MTKINYLDQLTYEERWLWESQRSYYHYDVWRPVKKLKIIEGDDKDEVERQVKSFINIYKITQKETTVLNISNIPHYQVSLWYDDTELDDYLIQCNNDMDERLAKQIIECRPPPEPEPEHIGAPKI